MDVTVFTSLLAFFLPFTSAMVCLCLVFPYSGDTNSETSLRIRKLLTVYFFICTFAWFGPLIYPFFHKAFVYIQSFVYLSFLFVQIIFYHFVFIVTRLDNNERFSPLHYLLPSLLCLVLFVWSFFVPFEVQVDIVRTKATVVPEGYEAYFYLFTSKMSVRFVVSVIYITFALIRLLRYRNTVLNFSANYDRSSLTWLYHLIFLSIGFLFMPLSVLYFGRDDVYNALISVFFLLLVFVQYIILTYNTLREKYLTLEDIMQAAELPVKADRNTDPDSKTEDNWMTERLSVSKLERYMEEYKPYCNPNLRIIDLAQQLGTNRSYLSSLINETYGLNFSRYINSLRLKELEKIQADPAYTKLTRHQQIEKAGFGSLRNYQRFKDTKEDA